MGTQLRRLASYVGVAVLVVTGLVGGATASSAEDPPLWTIDVNSGSCAVTAPVVTVTTMFGDGRDTSIGHSSEAHNDKWVHHHVPDGDYTMTLPEVAAGDTEQFHVSLEHDPGGDAADHWYPGPYTFSVPADCGGDSTFGASPIPTLTGTARVGSTLRALTGSWDPSPAFTYQWFRSGVPIAGATSQSHRLAAADLGRRMTVAVTGDSAGVTPARRTSTASAAVARGLFSRAPNPRITGRKKVRRTLTARAGNWSPAPSSVSYRWYRSGVLVRSATGKTYRVTRRDVRKKIRVAVTATKPGYVSRSRASATTSRIRR